MATTAPSASLPERPNVEQLRKRARELQRRVRAGDAATLRRLRLDAADPAFPLSSAQRLIARHYGFGSWTRLRDHVDAIAARTWVLPAAASDESPAHRVVRSACVTYGGDPPDPAAATALLREHPGLATGDLAVAAASADVAAVRALLAGGADAGGPVGPFGWSPLLYAAYSRLPSTAADTLATATALLDAGADPNDGRYFLGYPTPFTVLTGVFGDGEQGEPAHPHELQFARLLLEAGADPNDAQTLYNRMFGDDDGFLELLFEFGLGRGDGGPWRHRLPDLSADPTDLVRGLLSWAVVHDQRDRVARLARHGVDVVSRLPKGPGPFDAGATPVEAALRSGNREMAALLRELGAPDPALGPVDAFVAAALAGDAAAVAATPAAVVERARAARPGLLVWAAAQGRPAAVELIAAAGFHVDALGRSDVPLEQPWHTALHAAVERDDAATVRALLALGADPSIRDRRFDSTALGWANHFERPHLAALLEGPPFPSPPGTAGG